MNLFVVGKLSCKEIQKLELDYLKRIKNPILKIYELKAHSEDLKKESLEITNKIRSVYKGQLPYIILLTETGKLMDSPKYSKWLNETIDNKGDKILFIIGGAAGFHEDIHKLANDKLSLSPLTFPHKIARLLLVEQIYRAQTIKIRHPYHK